MNKTGDLNLKEHASVTIVINKTGNLNFKAYASVTIIINKPAKVKRIYHNKR